MTETKYLKYYSNLLTLYFYVNLLTVLIFVENIYTLQTRYEHYETISKDMA